VRSELAEPGGQPVIIRRIRGIIAHDDLADARIGNDLLHELQDAIGPVVGWNGHGDATRVGA
jgi:hypothetical protein